MSSLKFLTFYRVVNVLYAIYGTVLGTHLQDPGLISSSLILGAVDLMLLSSKNFDSNVLQPLRFMAATLLGPYWIFKGKVHRNLLLIIAGLSFVLFDGALFLKDFSA
jgi:hypothetical protein